jgi:hypothetical protein
MPQEKRIPRKLELRQIIIIIKINTIVLPLQFNDYYIACAVTSNSYEPSSQLSIKLNLLKPVHAIESKERSIDDEDDHAIHRKRPTQRP